MANRNAPSGLNGREKIKARSLTAHAMDLGLKRAPAIHYTQNGRRWDGIRLLLKAWKGKFPHYADCSAFVTWCLWNGLDHYSIGDIVNGQKWAGGYTGTLLEHGFEIHKWRHCRRGDVVIYGNGGTGKHTAIVRRLHPITRKPYVVSHGSESAPYYLPIDYRSDIMCVRRYI
jgi:hypothetical protein